MNQAELQWEVRGFNDDESEASVEVCSIDALRHKSVVGVSQASPLAGYTLGDHHRLEAFGWSTRSHEPAQVPATRAFGRTCRRAPRVACQDAAQLPRNSVPGACMVLMGVHGHGL